MAQEGDIQKLIRILDEALDRLKVPIPCEDLEAAVVAVYTAMGQPQRQFHTVEHIFSFADEDPIIAISALFHDVVYLNVDGGWPPSWKDVLSQTGGAAQALSLAPSSPIPFYSDILAVFGKKPGETPNFGSNELFSALTLSCSLGDFLGRELVLECAACVEATIPFRLEASAPVLMETLVILGLPRDRAEQAALRSVRFANMDLQDFCQADPGMFLSGSWKLLPELNPALRVNEQYTVASYRKALGGMEGFLASLTPEKIFHRWKDEPGEQEWKRITAQARLNLDTGIQYLGMKLMTAGILEAFAELTGGDAPLPLFMGSAGEGRSQRLEFHLPKITKKINTAVFSLLYEGRMQKTKFDIKNSPLAAYLYSELGEEIASQASQRAKDYFRGMLSAGDFLAGLPQSVIVRLANALSEFVPTRREKFSAWKEPISKNTI